jgi:hypothetical protein
VTLSSLAEFQDILENFRQWRMQFLDARGHLKPKFRPPPPAASFRQQPAAPRREQIPVPKGPVDVW